MATSGALARLELVALLHQHIDQRLLRAGLHPGSIVVLTTTSSSTRPTTSLTASMIQSAT